ncbi:DUF3578 domain-containing protein [Erythrobacter sp.]|nr:DUF3578 domain-containing protein [Erythrobacter sp.]
MQEYDELGRDAFLEKYGFGGATRYLVEHEGRRYDSKAIAGAAVGKQHSERGPLSPSEFSGGIASVGRKMAELGFPFIDTAVEQDNDRSIGNLLRNAMDEFTSERRTPFETKQKLWAAMESVKARLESFDAVASRPEIFCQWSLGAGNWLKVPWIALFDRRVTKSAQSGFYVVLLVAEDLSRVYLTLNQGATEVKATHGVARARTIMAEIAEQCREVIAAADTSLLDLNDGVDLRTEHSNSKFYELGAIAHAMHEPIEAAADELVERQLEQLLSAYEAVRLASEKSLTEADLMREHLDATFDECKSLGIGPFLEKYEYGRPRVYWVKRDGDDELYPAKASVGVAHKFLPFGKAMTFKEFHNGYGEQEALTTLRRLGFKVVNNRDNGASSPDGPSRSPTNLILFGPPGTGKTYRTAREAVKLCDPASDYPDNAEGRALLMQRYRALVDARQIEMVTFHQSFSYEEFIEGLRPETDSSSDSGGFNLKAESGLFVRIAERAQRFVRRGEAGVSLEGRKFFKMSLGQSDDRHSAWVFEDSLEEGYAIFGFRDVDWSDSRFDSRDEIQAELERRFPNETVTGRMGKVISPDQFRNHLENGDIILASKGLNAFRAIGVVEGSYEYSPRADGRYTHRRKVRWLWSDPEGLPIQEFNSGTAFSRDTIYPLRRDRLNVPAIERLINSRWEDNGEASSQVGELLPHVIIIDEINRANISKVFGELITLIEPDKRLGMANALKVRLPYSKREFGVPANLHIVGTMNTADRSIALLDTALRRRFRFEEMAPDTDVPAFEDAEQATGLPLSKLLKTMNSRIEYLVDRDHRIGHAFFIGCISKDDVDAVMRDKVIPLLQEYFFDDWNRLAAVLGEKDKGGNFLDCETIQDPMGEGGEPLKSWRVRGSFDEGAYHRLISGKAALSTEAEAEV